MRPLRADRIHVAFDDHRLVARCRTDAARQAGGVRVWVNWSTDTWTREKNRGGPTPASWWSPLVASAQTDAATASSDGDALWAITCTGPVLGCVVKAALHLPAKRWGHVPWTG